MPLRLLAVGAAKGIVSTLFPVPGRVEVAYAPGLVTRDAFVSGTACDVVILPASLMVSLRGRLLDGSDRTIGNVATTLAVPLGRPAPQPHDGDELRAVFLAASAIFVPDMTRSTAGTHFSEMLGAFGLRALLADRVRSFGTGEDAIAAMVSSNLPAAIGLAQATEVLATPSAVLAGPLPPPYALTTEYMVAVSAAATDRDAAVRFVKTLTGPGTAGLRQAAGFDEPGG